MLILIFDKMMEHVPKDSNDFSTKVAPVVMTLKPLYQILNKTTKIW